MTRHMKVSLSIAAVLACGGVCVRWFVKAPAARAARSSRVAGTPSADPSGAGYSTAPAILDVDLVKNGSLPEYKNTTVRQAFEGTFQDPEWKSTVNLQGQKVVTFQGTVKYAVLKEAGFYIGTWNGVRQGIEAEKQISEQRHRCSEGAGQTEMSAPDQATIGPCMAKAYQSMVIPVAFEFTLSPDKKTVEMTLPDSVFQKFDSDHRLKKQREATLAFIYQ
jgi:hypothetical protein